MGHPPNGIYTSSGAKELKNIRARRFKPCDMRDGRYYRTFQMPRSNFTTFGWTQGNPMILRKRKTRISGCFQTHCADKCSSAARFRGRIHIRKEVQTQCRTQNEAGRLVKTEGIAGNATLFNKA